MTHYWRRSPILDPAGFARAVSDCRTMMPLIGVALATRTGPAIFNDDLISFNGVGLQRCESLVVQQAERHWRLRGNAISFTKTNRLPYDRCVRVTLILLQHHLGNQIRVQSDDPNWDFARDLCQRHLGYGQAFFLQS